MESEFSNISLNNNEKENSVDQPIETVKEVPSSTSPLSPSPFNVDKEPDAASVTSSTRQAGLERTDSFNSKKNENFYSAFSSLVIDQLNLPDVNAILDAQQQM